MSQIINFKAKDKFGFDTQLKPHPASKSIPDWYKNAPIYEPAPNNLDGKKLSIFNGTLNHSFKKCTPMLEPLTFGYIIPLWADVLVSLKDGSPEISWMTETQIFSPHGDTSKRVEHPPGYTNLVVKYVSTWMAQTPAGYSCLITSPFGYRNLPFMQIPSIIDTDKSVMEGSFPMWIKAGFEGIVEKGTPLVQVIPFKRNDWKSTFDYYEDGEHRTLIEKTFKTTMLNHYTKNIWSKKDFK
jgi:hypothetical protein